MVTPSSTKTINHEAPIVRLVTDQEVVPGYTVYYVKDKDPTRELGESNWIVVTPAKYGACSQLALTGGGAMIPIGIVAAVLLVIGAGVVVFAARRRQLNGSDLS